MVTTRSSWPCDWWGETVRSVMSVSVAQLSEQIGWLRYVLHIAGMYAFTFHLGFVHPLQDVGLHQGLPLSSITFMFQVVFSGLHQCLPLSSITFMFQVVFSGLHQGLPLSSITVMFQVVFSGLHQCLPLSSITVMFQVVFSLFVVMSGHLLLGRPLDLFPLLGCHSVQRLVHLLSFIIAICAAHYDVCFSVYFQMSVLFVVFLISEHGTLSCKVQQSRNITNNILLMAVWASVHSTSSLPLLTTSPFLPPSLPSLPPTPPPLPPPYSFAAAHTWRVGVNIPQQRCSLRGVAIIRSRLG